MNANLHRRVAAAELKAHVGTASEIVVRRQPYGMDAAERAAWDAEQSPTAAGTLVLHLQFVPWPPRGDTVQRYLNGGLCSIQAELAGKIECLGEYDGKADALAALAL